MKEHLYKTLKNAKLTFEEYSILLCQVEACMNSRSLCPISDNVECLDTLTPGHFLIGQELLAAPQPKVENILTDHRDRWKHDQFRQNQLHLQQRYKWQERAQNAKQGDIVAIKDEDLAPRNWQIGRIESVQRGTDNQVRVVSLI